MFTELERAESSTFRELAAIKFASEAFLPALQHSKVKWFTDNQAAAKIIQVWSMAFNLHQMAFAFFSIYLKARIELDIQWIPCSLNEKADYLSKIIDYDDWKITPQLFRLLEGKFGRHTVDCFADYNNCKVQKLYSRFWNPGAAGIDAFFH